MQSGGGTDSIEKHKRSRRKSREPTPMKRRKPPRTREWKRRDKVSACISALFPWEVVFQILFAKSPRSLVLLQMVSKSVRATLAAERMLWIKVFKRFVFTSAYNSVKVNSSEYPGLNLYKPVLTGVPVHMGRIRTDPDGATLPPEFDESFCAYTRKAFALLSVDRCGLCGCRHRHEAYWSLGMRVCQLCMAENTISNWELVDKYGVHFYDIMRDISSKVFYFTMQATLSESRLAFHAAMDFQVMGKRPFIMFWRPHMDRLFDFPALYQEQKQRKISAMLLCAILRRQRVYVLRREHAKHPLRSPDCLVLKLFGEERRRVCCPYVSKWRNPNATQINSGDGTWAFWEAPVCGKSRHHRRHGELKEALASHMHKWEDIVISS